MPSPTYSLLNQRQRLVMEEEDDDASASPSRDDNESAFTFHTPNSNHFQNTNVTTTKNGSSPLMIPPTQAPSVAQSIADSSLRAILCPLSSKVSGLECSVELT